jgi:hypothetical protein
MMRVEFNKEIQRLVDVFGSKFFCDTRTQLLWQKFSTVPYFHFRDAVSHLVLNRRIVPVEKDMWEAIAIYREKYQQQKIQKENFESKMEKWKTCRTTDEQLNFYIKAFLDADPTKRGYKEFCFDLADKFEKRMTKVALEKGERCPMCRNRGWLPGYDRLSMKYHGWKCPCGQHAEKYKTYPTWKSKWYEKYELLEWENP